MTDSKRWAAFIFTAFPSTQTMNDPPFVYKHLTNYLTLNPSTRNYFATLLVA